MSRKRPFILLLVFILSISLAAAVPIAHGDGPNDFTPPEKQDLLYPNLGSHLNELVASVEESGTSAEEAAKEASIHSGESVAVTVYLSSNVDDVVQFLEDNGGDPRNVGEGYIEAYVPVLLLGQLSEQPGVIRVREIIPPQPLYGDITSQGVQKHLVQAWHDAGYSGQDVRVGIIDTGFEGFTGLLGSELPTPVTVRCYTDVGEISSSLADCENGSVHGTAVAESLIDIAPEASLYLSNVFSPGDLQDTVDWMISQGVDVINTSLGFAWDGPGDGSSPFDGTVDYVHPDWEAFDNSLHYSPLRAVDRAVDAGIVWITAAGNDAQKTWFESGSSLVLDSDGFVEFDPSDILNCFLLHPDTVFSAELRWEDTWGGATLDLDLYLWDIPRGTIVLRSEDVQSGDIGHFPYEYIDGRYSGSTETAACWVVRHVGGSRPDWIQLRNYGSSSPPLQYNTGEGSISNPAESAKPGLLAVGATHYWDTSTIADYSSQGPTPDGRVKPDIVGAACAETASNDLRPSEFYDGNNCWFSGTSQASPQVAGLAALVRQKFPNYTPQQVTQFLKDNADERGEPGDDNTWGSGFALLPPPTDDCGEILTADETISGTWASGCDSEVSGRGHARYYGFTLVQESEVTISLESDDADTYLYLREGEARSGTALHENDDHDNAGLARSADSQIRETLAAGSYTIEATTYEAGQTGSFTLTVSGLGGTAPTPGPDPGTDECGTTLPSDDPAVVEYVFPNEQWAAGCDSEVSGRGHARYYGFTLVQESEVTISLESDDADTYLYLREGEARSGTALHENDDHDNAGLARSADSQIRETLAAGSYTIEATTYEAGQTGSFTLTVSGLGGGALPKPTVIFAGLNWNSALVQNFIAQYIVERGYGYPTDEVQLSSQASLEALRAGEVHLMMEVWLPTQSEFWDPALEAGDVLSLGTSLGSDWQSAFVIPAYLQQQHPGLDTVQDLKEQRYKSLFATAETGGKARLVSCVPGWSCEVINADQVAGYGLDEHVHIVNPGSQDALFASINGAYDRREPWLGYMWGTSDPALLLDLVRLEEPPYSDECWNANRACAYQDDTILIGAHSGLPDQAPEVVEFLRKWDFDTEVHLRSVTRWQANNPNASIEDTGLYWLRNNVDTWSGWVTSEAAARIRSALSAGTSDRAALMALYDATGGPDWADNSSWGTDASLGEWYGIETDDSGRVIGIDLRENSLSGQIPGSLGELGSLRYLFLSNADGICDDGCEPSSPTANRLPGPIPSEMSKLANLRDLRLAFLQLSGPAPAWMGDLSNLQVLELTANELSGNIPAQLGNLTNLTFLTLGHNRLTGTMPAIIGDLTGLEVLTLHDNQLTGSIPSNYGNLSNLTIVFLFSGNQLTGCIPAGLQRVPRNDFPSQLPFCSQ